MCGRYVLSLRPSEVRQRLADHHNMPVDDAPADDNGQTRETYNFAPGYHGLIYRAQRHGGGDDEQAGQKGCTDDNDGTRAVDGRATQETKYKLQAAKWGLIPFWTKRAPDYGSQLRTINCRDDSLIENRGMWNTMKQRKRCIVVAEGFYEWLKKNDGKERIPYFTRRKDGQLMAFAGLWDMVQYEGSEEKLYTYTIITTDSNKQLKFLHDRMPVILESGSDEMKLWLDPNNIGWSKELQSILKPFDGELECFPVDKGVGKVGNNSPTFVIPIDSKENKKNIANFFDTQRAKAKNGPSYSPEKIKRDPDEDRETTIKAENTEDNAPLPKPTDQSDEKLSQQIKRETDGIDGEDIVRAADDKVKRGIKRESYEIDDDSLLKASEGPPSKTPKANHASPSPTKTGGKSTRSATSNNTVAKTPTKGNTKITSFFGK